MSSPITQAFPPNRIAVIASILTSLTAFITGIAKVLPGSWENYALAGTGLLGQVIATLKFLEGSQKFDALQARERLEYVRQGAIPAGRTYVVPAQDE